MLIVLNAKSYAESTKKAAKETPAKIRSDIIDIKRKSQTVTFVGNVIIEKDDSSLLSQKMIVLYDEKKEKKPAKKENVEEVTESGSGSSKPSELSESPEPSEPAEKSSIKKIYTDEKVKIFSEDFVASGESGYYEPKEDVFVLEKNVVVNNGVSIAKGDKFIHHITTKKSYFAGQKDQKDDGRSAEKNNNQNQDDGVDKRVVVIIGNDVKDIKKTRKKEKNE